MAPAGADSKEKIMAGPYVYLNPLSLRSKLHVADIAGNYEGECVSLVKKYIPELQNRSTRAWIEGPNVVETIKKGGTIMEGTAIATFVDGRFISGHGHAAFYVGWINDPNEGIRIRVVEQYLGEYPTEGVVDRLLHNWGKNPDGSYPHRSNNSAAFSVIL
jgi:hypothetical protein